MRHAQCVATTNQALSGALPTIDGYAVQDSDRVLLTAQTTASQNGPWVAHTTGWVRPDDFPTTAVLTSRSMKVTGGTVYGPSDWVLASTSSITVDTTAQTWTQVKISASQLPSSVVSVPSATAGWVPEWTGSAWTGIAHRYGLAIGRGGCIVPIGAHTGVFANFQSNGTTAAANYRTYHPLTDSQATTVLPVFGNHENLGLTGDVTPPNPITISAAVELSDGTVIPFVFSGQHTVTIGSGLAIPDYPITFGAQVTDGGWPGTTGVVIRTFVTVAASRTDSATLTNGSPTVTDASITAADQGRAITAGGGVPSFAYVGTVTPGVSFLLSSRPDSQVNVNANAAGTGVTLLSYIPLNHATNAFGNKSVVSATDLTLEGSAAGSAGFGGGNANGYGPCVLLGLPPQTRKPILASLTDSIFYGTSDSNVGPVARACTALGIGHIKISKVGETASSLVTPVGRKYRATLIPGATHIVIELGTNDGADTTAKATALQTNLTTLITYLHGLGMQVILTTVPPKGTSSTDGYATTAGQTPYNSAAGLAQINSWIRGLPAGVASYIEINTPVSSAQDSGLWKQAPNARTVTDAATTNGSSVVTSATANFTSADIGSAIYIAGVYTNYLAVINTVTNSTTVNITFGLGGSNFNAGSTGSGLTLKVGSWYATQDGTHPSNAMMTGPVLTNVQAALAALTAA